MSEQEPRLQHPEHRSVRLLARGRRFVAFHQPDHRRGAVLLEPDVELGVAGKAARELDAVELLSHKRSVHEMGREGPGRLGEQSPHETAWEDVLVGTA